MKFDLNKKGGPFKLLNAVNNGPCFNRFATQQKRSNFELYKAARIPFARNHNAAHFSGYGGVYAAISGLSNGASNLLGLIVNTMMPISIVSPLSAGIKNLISFLFSVFIFREKLGKRQIIGVVLGTAALILFKI